MLLWSSIYSKKNSSGSPLSQYVFIWKYYWTAVLHVIIKMSFPNTHGDIYFLILLKFIPINTSEIFIYLTIKWLSQASLYCNINFEDSEEIEFLIQRCDMADIHVPGYSIQNKPTIFINGKWHIWILYFVVTNFLELLWPVSVVGVQGHQGVIQSILLHIHLIVRLIESWREAVNIFNVDENYSSGRKWKKSRNLISNNEHQRLGGFPPKI